MYFRKDRTSTNSSESPQRVESSVASATNAEEVSLESLGLDDDHRRCDVWRSVHDASAESTTLDASAGAASPIATWNSGASAKRTDFINWEEMFMGVALLAAKRSKDPCTQVGAVIVNEDQVIVSIGYNGMPVGISDDEFPWGKDAENPLDNKYAYVCHAEMNAILNKNTANVKGCTIYTTCFPCNECAKLIIQSRISRIIYLGDKPNKPEMVASKRMLNAVGVSYSQFSSSRRDLLITFSSQS